ncbi:superoxide dismutase family protein [soil metagenome]
MSLHRIGLLCLSVGVLGGCMHKESTSEMSPATTRPMPSDQLDAAKHEMAPMMKKVAVAKIGPSNAATTQPTNNNVMGMVTFTEADGKMYIVADVTGLAPNSKHGIHIHDKGDLTAADLSSAGGHYDPGMIKHHGMPNEDMKLMSHAGDLGNLVADDKGVAHLELTVEDLTIDGAKNAIVGRSVIIHAKVDDLKTQPTGNSGGRVAGGVIERTSQQ